MDKTTDTLPEHIKLRLIAAAVGLQQCTQTSANIVPLPGTDRFVTIGAPAEVWQLLRRQMPAEESPPNAGAVDAETTLPEDVAAVFAACGFEIRSTDPAEKHPLAVAGSLDAAGLVVEMILTRLAPGPDAIPEEFIALLPGVCYMDPPDGGSVSVLEQFRRMAQDAGWYRWLRDKSEPGICAFYLSVGQAFKDVRFKRETVDSAIDAQMSTVLANTQEGAAS